MPTPLRATLRIHTSCNQTIVEQSFELPVQAYGGLVAGTGAEYPALHD